MRLFETSRQMPLVSVFFLLGVILGAVFEFFGIFRHNKISMHISDGVFALLFGIMNGATAYLFNSGELHLYFFVSEILGVIAEHKTLGNFIKIFMDFLHKIMYNLFIGKNESQGGITCNGEQEEKTQK